jgi:hypothetical protein
VWLLSWSVMRRACVLIGPAAREAGAAGGHRRCRVPQVSDDDDWVAVPRQPRAQRLNGLHNLARAEGGRRCRAPQGAERFTTATVRPLRRSVCVCSASGRRPVAPGHVTVLAMCAGRRGVAPQRIVIPPPAGRHTGPPATAQWLLTRWMDHHSRRRGRQIWYHLRGINATLGCRA